MILQLANFDTPTHHRYMVTSDVDNLVHQKVAILASYVDNSIVIGNDLQFLGKQKNI